MKWLQHAKMFEMKSLRILQGRTPGSVPRTTASLAACVSREKSDKELKSMNRSWRMCAAVSVVAFLGGVWPTWTNVARAEGNDKVEICHFPPGNPGNYQTITISASALAAHLAHGDFPGPCFNDCRLFGSVCDDSDACTGDGCNPDGTCQHSAPTDCNDSNVCTGDSCDPTTGNCVNAPQTGGTCDDGNDCTSPDTCTSIGTCHGTPITGCCNTATDCGDGNLCTSDVCTNHTCSNPPVSCPAPDRCTIATCNPTDGSCEQAPISCDDNNACTTDTCDSATGCVHTQICCSYPTSGIRTACDYFRSSGACQQCLQTQCPTAYNTCYGAATTYSCACASGCGTGNDGCAAGINQCTQCASACCPG